MADEDEAWAKLAKNLKAEIDPELIKAYRGTVSLPFEPGRHKRIAVKIVDDRGLQTVWGILRCQQDDEPRSRQGERRRSNQNGRPGP